MKTAYAFAPRAVAACVLAGLVPGCGGSDVTVPGGVGTGGNTGVDAAPQVDGAPSADAGPRVDGGPLTDSGLATGGSSTGGSTSGGSSSGGSGTGGRSSGGTWSGGSSTGGSSTGGIVGTGGWTVVPPDDTRVSQAPKGAGWCDARTEFVLTSAQLQGLEDVIVDGQGIGSPLSPLRPPATGGAGPGDDTVCFAVLLTELSWSQQKASCEAWGGELAEINSPEAALAIGNVFHFSAWTGGTLAGVPNAWEWLSGDPVPASVMPNWHSAHAPPWLPGGGLPMGEPGADCLEFKFMDYFDDLPCNMERAGLCWRPRGSGGQGGAGGGGAGGLSGVGGGGGGGGAGGAGGSP